MYRLISLVVIICGFLPRNLPAQENTAVSLAYRFETGQILDFEVRQKTDIKTTIQGQGSDATIVNNSLRRWIVKEVDNKGNATIELSTLRVQMHSKEGLASVEFDSEDSTKQPAKYQSIMNAVGKPLSRIRISPQGAVLAEQKLLNTKGLAQVDASKILPPLSDQPIKLGGSWKHQYEIPVIRAATRFPARQTFTLKSIENNTAIIAFKTEIIAPVSNPQLLAELVQHRPSGTIHFDLRQGQIVAQISNLDETVVGFAGPASAFQIKSTSIERLIGDSIKNASVTRPSRD